MKAPELQAELLETDFSALVREPWWQCLLRLVLHGGLHTGNGIENWVDTLLLNKLNAHSRVRLRDLLHTTTVYACQGNDPTVTFASNDPATRDEYAAYAVRCSMSIPFFFTPGRKGGMHIFDGGLKQNYPVEELLKHSPHAAFIGLYLGAPYEPDAGKGVVKAFWESLFEANDKVQLEKHKEHTVIIDTRPVTTLDFKLSNAQKQFLLLSGRVAALKFLKKKKIDLADRADMEELMQAHDELRQSLLLARAERLQWRWRAAWGTLLLIVAVAWSSRLV
jgi:predicted acylesterase/phospholipase RssA